jgi:hypothetical protein
LFLYNWFRNQFAAFKIGVSSVAWPAGTDTSVVSSLTVCIGSTVTRIYTFLIATSQSCVAFWISQTLIRLAFYIRATLVTRRTLASSSVNIDSTQSFDTTLLIRTWVLTFSLDTCLTQRTLIVTFASRFFTNTIWISLKPLFAIADCTMSGHPAFSIDSTSSGEAGVLTFFANTCKMIWAFRISGALWFYRK